MESEENIKTYKQRESTRTRIKSNFLQMLMMLKVIKREKIFWLVNGNKDKIIKKGEDFLRDGTIWIGMCLVHGQEIWFNHNHVNFGLFLSLSNYILWYCWLINPSWKFLLRFYTSNKENSTSLEKFHTRDLCESRAPIKLSVVRESEKFQRTQAVVDLLLS